MQTLRGNKCVYVLQTLLSVLIDSWWNPVNCLLCQNHHAEKKIIISLVTPTTDALRIKYKKETVETGYIF